MTPTRTRRPGRPAGVQPGPAERRRLLVAAAERAIREHGPGVSMEQIAEAAEVAKATLYDNFDGKAGLTVALLDRYGRRLLEQFAAGLSEPLTPEQVIRTGIAIFVRHIEDEPEIYRFISLHSEADQLLSEIAQPIEAMVRAFLRHQGDERDDVVPVVFATLGAIITASQRWSLHHEPSRERFEVVLGDFVWGGLTAGGIRPSDRPVDLTDVVALVQAPLDLPPGI